MRILLTGHDGYIGHVLTPMLLERGHEVTGLDSCLYEGCGFAPEEDLHIPVIRKDIREVTREELRGFDAVAHLAGISNDPLGDLAPQTTYSINHEASVRLAKLAKQAGVTRYVFSSSCSNYGAAGDDYLTEEASFNPVTPYAESKVWTERDVALLADDDTFSPTFLRSSTAYGVSARLRGDLVVNNLVGYAYTTGQVLIKSDGMPWRPLVHIEDISRAFVAVLEAPRELIHKEAFNVGRSEENYRVREVAQIVSEVVPKSKVTYAGDSSPDKRNYRVSCDKIAKLPGFSPTWTVRKGIEQVYDAFRRHATSADEFLSSQFVRLKRIKELQESGALDPSLSWRARGRSAA